MSNCSCYFSPWSSWYRENMLWDRSRVDHLPNRLSQYHHLFALETARWEFVHPLRNGVRKGIKASDFQRMTFCKARCVWRLMHFVSELLETCPLTGLSFSPTLQSIQEKREDEEQKSFRLSDSWNERAALVVLSCCVWAVVSQITLPSQLHTGCVFVQLHYEFLKLIKLFEVSYDQFGGFWRDHGFDAGYASRCTIQGRESGGHWQFLHLCGFIACALCTCCQ